jgi:hypothetical protein
MRFAADHAATPDRTMVSYRVSSASHNLQFDPLYAKVPSLVTTQWRDPLLARPENALLGTMFSGFTTRPTNFAWHVSPHVSSDLLNATGLLLDKEYGCGLVGNLWNRVFENGATPTGLSVLATSKTTAADSQPDLSNTTSYIASSGALVFSTGSLYWSRGLDSYRFHQDPQCPPQESAVPEIQHLMTNVMSALVAPYKPSPLTQSGLSPLVVTTPYALNGSAAQPQGGFVGTRNGPAPIYQPGPPPFTQPLPQKTVVNQPPRGPQNAPAGNKGSHSGGPPVRPPHSHHSSNPGSFYGGRHGQPVTSTLTRPHHTSTIPSPRSDHEHQDLPASSPQSHPEGRYQQHVRHSLHYARYWGDILSQFLRSLQHSGWHL